MNSPYAVGRILLVILFIIFGISKLMDIDGTAVKFEKVPIPAFLAATATQLSTAVGLSIPKLLAVMVGLIELVGGLMIALNTLARTAAVVLLLYTGLTTLYFHDFWTMTGEARLDNMTHALKNLSIIGALLMLAALPQRLWVNERDAYYPDDRYGATREREGVRDGPPPGREGT